MTSLLSTRYRIHPFYISYILRKQRRRLNQNIIVLSNGRLDVKDCTLLLQVGFIIVLELHVPISRGIFDVVVTFTGKQLTTYLNLINVNIGTRF